MPNLPQPVFASIRRIATLSLLVAGLAIAARESGILEQLELAAFDQFVRWKPASPPDPRLLIVGISEDDIANQGKSDRAISQAINKLQSLQPRVIGLDLYRDLPAEPGHQDLLADLKINQNVIVICGSGVPASVAPPAGVPESRIGFSDVVLDRDRVLRRNLLTLPVNLSSRCRSPLSFGMLIALHYLAQQNITQTLTPQEQIQIGSTVFPRLSNPTGGYANLDTRGYQIFFNYRSPVVAEQVTLQQVLQGKVNPNQVKDRIILIGVTAESEKDYFFTPYSGSNWGAQMAGVSVHAQSVSQILSTVLDRQPLLWTWTKGIDWLWIWVWGAAGAVLVGWTRRPLLQTVVIALGLASLTGVSFLLFTQAGWVPLIPAGFAFVIGALAAIATQKAATSPSPLSSAPNSPTSPPTIATQASPNPPPVPTPTLLKGRYQLNERLGHGGFGITHLAKDMQRPGQPTCVVKQLKLNVSNETELQMARELFQREAQTLETLGNHDQIPRLLAYFEEAQEFYLVQDYVPGTVLNQIIGDGQTLPEAEVVTLLRETLPILEFIHSKGVIHRDIKPSNLIRRHPDDRIVLIDFGAVKQLQSTVAFSPGSVIIGTHGYAAPEQMRGKPVFSSDIYALGMVALQALGGLAIADLQQIGDPEPQWPASLTLPEPLAAILTQMVQYAPSDRFQSAHDVLHSINSNFS
jgi:CHASE2 domain-containing sensor protein